MFATVLHVSQEVIAVIEITSTVGRADLKISLTENSKVKSMLDVSSPDEPELETFISPMVMALFSFMQSKSVQ